MQQLLEGFPAFSVFDLNGKNDRLRRIFRQKIIALREDIT